MAEKLELEPLELEPIDGDNLPRFDEEMGAGEAAARHAVDAATLGLSDIGVGGVEGAIGEAKDYLAGEGVSYQDFLDRYYKSKKESEALRSEGFEANPAASIAGMIGGSVAIPIPGAGLARLGKTGAKLAKFLPSMKGFKKAEVFARQAKTAKKAQEFEKAAQLTTKARKLLAQKAAIEGAKVGGIASLTHGDARLLDGDISGSIKEYLGGAAVGAITSAAFSGVSDVTLNWVQNSETMKMIYAQGVSGMKLMLKNESAAMTRSKDMIPGLIKIAEKARKRLGGKFAHLKKAAEKEGITIDTSKPLEDLLDSLKKHESPNMSKAVKDMIAELEYFSGKEGDRIVQMLQEKAIGKSIVRNYKKQHQAFRKHQIKAAKEEIKRGAAVDTSKGVVKKEGVDIATRLDTYKAGVTDEGLPKLISKLQLDDISKSKPSVQKMRDPRTGREGYAIVDEVSGRPLSAVKFVSKEKIDAANLSFGTAEELKKSLNAMTRFGETQGLPSDVAGKVKYFTSNLNDKILKALPPKHQELYGQYSGVMNAMRLLKSDVKVNTPEGREKIQNKLLNIITSNDDMVAESFLQDLHRYARQYDTKFADKVVGNIIKGRNDYLSHRSVGASWASDRGYAAVLGSTRELATTLSNAAGFIVGLVPNAIYGAVKQAIPQSIKKVSKNLAKRSLALVNATPDDLRNIAARLGASDNKTLKGLAQVLYKAETANHRQRQAILYGIMQQPAFREFLSSDEEE